MVQGRIIRRADVGHCSPSNGGVDLVGGGSRVLVKCNHYDVKVGYDGGRSKEVLEPITSVRHTGIMAVIINVGLWKIYRLVCGLELKKLCVPYTKQMSAVSHPRYR
jgi:hypothetical protein